MKKTYGTHPACEMLPPMPLKAFEDLRASIKEIGLQHAITVTPDDLILDGKNRYRACMDLGIAPTARVLELDADADPMRWVLEMNRHRLRTKAQLALAAARLATLQNGQRPTSIEAGAVTIDEAARLCGVSRSAVERAKAILEKGVPELVTMVECGELTIHPAAVVADLPKKQQTQAAAESPRAVRKLAADIREMSRPRTTNPSSDPVEDARIAIDAAMRMTDPSEREDMSELLRGMVEMWLGKEVAS
jgi:ParB-like chromosome segregation protein Spo0J